MGELSRTGTFLAEETDITLIQLAIAFVLNHPAVTAAIIGPHTMQHLESQLAGADVVLGGGGNHPVPAREDICVSTMSNRIGGHARS